MLRSGFCSGTCPKVRQPHKGDIDLHRRAPIIETVQRPFKRQYAVVDIKFRERKFRIKIRHNDVSAENPRVLVASFDTDICYSAVLRNHYFRDFFVAENFCTVTFRRRAESIRNPPHAALLVRPNTARTTRLAHHVVKKHIAGKLSRTNQRVREERRLEHVRLKPPIEVFDRVRQEKTEQRKDLERKELACMNEKRSDVFPVTQCSWRNVGWRHAHESGHPFCDARERCFVLGIRQCVLNGKLCNLAPVEFLVSTKHEIAPIRKRRKRRGIPRQHFVTVFLELKVANNLRREEAIQVC